MWGKKSTLKKWGEKSTLKKWGEKSTLERKVTCRSTSENSCLKITKKRQYFGIFDRKTPTTVTLYM